MESEKLQEATAASDKSILIIDDDQLLRDMYTLKFQEQGFTVEAAAGGSEGLERLRGGFSPTVITFDLVMPGVDGYEFMQTVHDEKLAPHSKKIALSNQNQDSDVEKMKALGVTGFIVKANTIPSEVVNRVMEMIREKK